jgi:hypothetical protein
MLGSGLRCYGPGEVSELYCKGESAVLPGRAKGMLAGCGALRNGVPERAVNASLFVVAGTALIRDERGLLLGNFERCRDAMLWLWLWTQSKLNFKIGAVYGFRLPLLPKWCR